MHVPPALIIPSVYACYVMWVVTSGEYTTHRHVSWFGSMFFGDLIESQTVTKEDMPVRFWLKVGVDIVVIVALTIAILVGSAGIHGTR